MRREAAAMSMSVEQPLWRALTAYRALTAVYAVAIAVVARDSYERPQAAFGYLAVLLVWTLATLPRLTGADRCTRPFLAVDVGLALAGILLTPLADGAGRHATDGPTLPSIWTAGAVLACALKGGWRWAAAASTLVGAANLVQRGEASRNTLHNVLLVWVAAIAIGYVVEVARASERTLARALEIQAATKERERLARDIHDGVLQVLAMVQRRGTAVGGEAAELGRLAGEQEAALRRLITRGPVPGPRPAAVPGTLSGDLGVPGDEVPEDLMALLGLHADARVTLSGPGTPVELAPHAARETAAAVGAALDNVRTHVGPGARAWVLVEDEPDQVLVSVRDEGPGIPEGRLAEAAEEGRLGVAQSIRGRLRDLGGTAELVSVPGQGTEVELTVPKDRGDGREAAATGRRDPARAGEGTQ
ncbi:MacS family sensor histidine kinase [Streptomyces sp. BBFR102]|uniref:MacS family sensor histidine kinase n=1 Tax=Streptomyces sp. BBFR102 TaxID=3448171 RepID=UPI003F5392F5